MQASDTPQAGSSLPRLTVNIGITGHRYLAPDHEPALRRELAAIFRCVREQVQSMLNEKEGPVAIANELYAPEPRFVLLSPLAKGADSLAAEEALALGYELHVPLPMAREEYEKDFEDEESRATYRRLLAEAERFEHIYEIRDSHPERSHAYADATRMVLNHSDVLIALWNNADTKFIAGTAATVSQASSMHIPVIHVHAEAAEATCFMADGIRSTNWQNRLRTRLQCLLLPVEAHPTTRADKAQAKADLKFVRSCAREGDSAPWCPGIITRAEKKFKALIGLLPPYLRKPVEVDMLDTNKEVFTAQNLSILATWHQQFRKFDKLAGDFSARYRGGLFLRYQVPFFATFFLCCALYCATWNLSCPEILQPAWSFVCRLTWSLTWTVIQLLGWQGWFDDCSASRSGVSFWQTLWFASQAFFLAIPILMYFVDKYQMWHRKFFSYRVVAEHLRQTQFLGPVGFFMVREKESVFKDSPQRWTAWYYRALIREEGLPHAVVTHEYLSNWLAWTRDRFVVEQENYHMQRQLRDGRLTRKLVLIGMWLFGMGFVAAVIRGVVTVTDVGELTKSIAVTFALCCPAYASFLAGFSSYACYAKNHQVSVASSNTLQSIRREIDVFLRNEGRAIAFDADDEKEATCIRTEPLNFSRAYNIAEQINECCKSELLGWEDLISTRSIKFM